MIGNAAEWLSDWYQADYYSSYPVDAWPPNPTGPISGTLKAVRPTNLWGFDGDNTLTFRHAANPNDYVDWEVIDFGFRCARSAGEE